MVVWWVGLGVVGVVGRFGPGGLVLLVCFGGFVLFGLLDAHAEEFDGEEHWFGGGGFI